MEQKLKNIKSHNLKISVTGPESTGKSILTDALVRYYNTCSNPEFAREYLEHINRPYEYSDVEYIGQKQKENECLLISKANKLLVCDTDLLVIKTWMDFKYGRHPQWISDWLKDGGYDLFILCNIDIPWEPDPLREHPEARQTLFNIYHDELQLLKKPYIIVSGNHDQRMALATKAIDELLENF